MLVADAYRVVSEALARTLRRDYGFDVIDDLPNSGQQVISAAGRHKPHVVVLDCWIPGMEAPAATRLILGAHPTCKVILLSWLIGTEQIKEGLEAGAVAFLPKTVTLDQLAEAIRRAWAGESPVDEDSLNRMILTMDERRLHDDEAWQSLAALTSREIEILELMDKGRLIEDVAKELAIKPSTVRKHIHNILEKTGALTYVQALAIVRRHGIIRP